jgi:predicted SAM-dependent methyltransferase
MADPSGGGPGSQAGNEPPADGLRLHIGGEQVREGWSIVNIQARPGVDHVGNCTDLSPFADASCSEIYASHVMEHLGYNGEIQQALKEFHRVLMPGGRVRISVPDLELLCRIFLHPQLTHPMRFHIMRIMYGGRTDPFDVHCVGLTEEFLGGFLVEAGFQNIRRVSEFGVFTDTSSLRLGDTLISLNMEAWK